VDIKASVIDLAKSLALVVEEPVILPSTNNLVMWLRPSPVVAKVSAEHGGSADELWIARMLAHAGAPIVPPAEGIGHEVYRAENRSVTFWRYESQENVAETSSESVAQSLGALHGALATLNQNIDSRTHRDQIAGAIRALDRPTFAPELLSDDRRHLRQALAQGLMTLGETVDDGHIIHGSPHRFNILVVAGSPRFIDFETVERGPLEWDLAHLEPEVADRYPDDLSREVLACCRLLISALTSTWCWDGLTRGPDMRAHAEHHLAVVRSSLG
jgi:hypothetical protein